MKDAESGAISQLRRNSEFAKVFWFTSFCLSKSIHAVFENGVFRPVEFVDLPEKAEVELEPRLVSEDDGWPAGYIKQTAGAFAGELLRKNG